MARELKEQCLRLAQLRQGLATMVALEQEGTTSGRATGASGRGQWQTG